MKTWKAPCCCCNGKWAAVPRPSLLTVYFLGKGEKILNSSKQDSQIRLFYYPFFTSSPTWICLKSQWRQGLRRGVRWVIGTCWANTHLQQVVYQQMFSPCTDGRWGDFAKSFSFQRIAPRQVSIRLPAALLPFAGGKAMDCRHLFDALPSPILNKANITLKGIFRNKCWNVCISTNHFPLFATSFGFRHLIVCL